MPSYLSLQNIFASTTTDSTYLLSAFLPLLILSLIIVIGIKSFKYIREYLIYSVITVSDIKYRKRPEYREVRKQNWQNFKKRIS